MSLKSFRLAAMVVAALLVNACQSVAAARPAVLTTPDSQTLTRLKAVLAKAMNVPKVEIGPVDPAQPSSLSVLPPPLGPYETRSPATPVVFDIISRGGTCFAVRRDTGQAYELSGVSCMPVKP